MATKWKSFQASDLNPENAKLFAAFMAAQKAAKEARIALETGIAKVAGLPADKALVFSYKFGPSMAVVAANEVRRASGTNAKPKQTLAEYLAEQR